MFIFPGCDCVQSRDACSNCTPTAGQGNQPQSQAHLVESTIPPKAATSSTGASAMSADFIKEVASATDKDAKTNAPIDKTTIFPAGQKQVVLTARVENPPGGVKLKAVWYTVSLTGSGTKLFQHPGVPLNKDMPGIASYQIERTDRPGEPFPNGSYRLSYGWRLRLSAQLISRLANSPARHTASLD